MRPADSAAAELILRPRLSYTWPALLVCLVIVAAGAWFLRGGVQHHDVRALTVGAVIVVAAVGPLTSWYLQGKVFVTATAVGKTDWVGRTFSCPRAEVAEVKTLYMPQPTIVVMLRDGRVGLRINRRWWNGDQLQRFEQATQSSGLVA